MHAEAGKPGNTTVLLVYCEPRNAPDSVIVLLSTSSVVLLELTRTAPPLLLSRAVTLAAVAWLKAPAIALELTAKPAVNNFAIRAANSY